MRVPSPARGPPAALLDVAEAADGPDPAPAPLPAAAPEPAAVEAAAAAPPGAPAGGGGAAAAAGAAASSRLARRRFDCSSRTALMPAVFLNSGADVSTPNRSSPSNSPRKRSSDASNSKPERLSFPSSASRSREEAAAREIGELRRKLGDTEERLASAEEACHLARLGAARVDERDGIAGSASGETDVGALTPRISQELERRRALLDRRHVLTNDFAVLHREEARAMRGRQPCKSIDL